MCLSATAFIDNWKLHLLIIKLFQLVVITTDIQKHDDNGIVNVCDINREIVSITLNLTTGPNNTLIKQDRSL